MERTDRPVSLPWDCQRSGDCCRYTSQVVMTPQEAQVIHDVRPDLLFYRHPDQRFVYLKAKPCPLLRMDGQVATCTVHEIRPYNCRRFGCYRPDPQTEPYEPEQVDLMHQRLGCANLSDRLLNRKVRKDYAIRQRKAARWARQHGWDESMAGTVAGSNVRVYQLTPV